MPETTTTIELLPPAESAEATPEEVMESAPTDVVEEPEPAAGAAPKKRGRPPGAKNKAKPPTTVSTPPVAPVAPVVVAEQPEIELPPPVPKAKAKTKAKPKPKARPVQYESESEEEQPTPRTARRNAWSAFREHQAFEHAARRDAFERRISMFMN
jgi:hypothetical protein